MSVNLTLIFDKFGSEPILAFTRMRMDWVSDEWYARVRSLSIQLQKPIQYYDDGGLEDRFDDEYGKPLESIAAYHLKRCMSELPLDELSRWDCAIKCFVDALPDDMRIVLFWS